MTSREGDDYHNRVFSMDLSYRLSDSDTITFNGVGSQTEYNQEMADSFDDVEAGEEISDHAIFLQYNRSKRNYWMRATYNDYGKNFRSDLGFIPQVNFKRLIAGGGRVWHGDGNTYYNRMELGGDWDQTETEDGELLEREYEMWFNLRGPKESDLNGGAGYRTRAFGGQFFDQAYQRIWYSWRQSGNLWLGGGINHSDWIDFTHVREAERWIVDPEITVNLGAHLKASLEYRYQELDVDGGNLFTAHLPELRVVYQHNLRTFVRTIFQYTNIDRNVELYTADVDPKSEDLLAQILFSYKLNPQTVAFVGYTDSYEGNQDFELKERERNFFIKIGYAWLK